MRLSAVSILMAGMLALPGASWAAHGRPPPGVHVDPNSPAGKEYQIPVTAIRSQLAPKSGSTASGGGSSPPLFGVGITSGGSGGTRAPTAGGPAANRVASASARPGHRRTSSVPLSTTRGRKRSRVGAVAPPSPTSSASASGTSAWIPLFAGGVLVLLLGGGGGLLLRQRLSRT